MKTPFLLLSLFFISYISNAQINKGNFLLGGSASYNSHKVGPNSSDRQSSFSIAPNVGYFVINKLAIGLRPGFSGDRFHTSSFYSKSSRLDISPFLKYYFLPASQKVNVFAEGAYLHSSGKTKYIYPTASTSKSEYNGYILSAGPAFFLNKNVSLELRLSYQKNTTYKDKTFLAGAGFQVHI